MKTHTPFQILIAVPCASLRDTISQILWDDRVQLAYAQNVQELFRPAPTQPDIIVAEPFAFGEPGLDLLKRLKQQTPTVPLIVLLPFDTRDYRDAVIRVGANSVVITEELATNLWSTIEQWLTRKECIDGVVNPISPIAQHSAPVDESVFCKHSEPSSLSTPSDQTLESPTLFAPFVVSPDKSTITDEPSIAKTTQTSEHYLR